MATLGTDKQWWPTREPPTRQPDEVDMDTTRRETRRNVNLRLPFHDAQCAVVCQEGCYPDKKAHVNQDTFILETKFAGEREHVLIGVFDGHGGAGEHAAQITAATFPRELDRHRRDPELESHGDRTAPVPLDARATAYARAFVDTDVIIQKNLGDACKSSGTTAVVAHIVQDMLHMGNVGDSRAILGTAREGVDGNAGAWDIVEVTHDQTCFRRDERERMRKEAKEPVLFATLGMILGETPLSEDFGDESIEAADDPPRVFRNGASYPGCAFTRSLGDTVGKRLGVSSDPELLTYQLDKNSRCLVMASDGVFEFMTNEEVMAAAKRHWGNALAACEEIVATAYDYWATEDSRSDDVTCAVVFLTPRSGAADGADLDDLGLPKISEAKDNWRKLRDVLRAGAIKNRPAIRFANAVLAKMAIDVRHRRGSLAMEELFPGFDFESVGLAKRMSSLKGGLAHPDDYVEPTGEDD